MNNLRQITGICLVVFIFIGFAMEICLLKGHCAVTDGPGTIAVHDYFEGHLRPGRSAGRPNLRITSSMLGIGLSYFFRGVTHLGFHNAETSPLFKGSPWPITYLNDDVASGPMILMPTMLMFAIIALSPLLLLTMLWFGPVWQRLVVISVLCSGIIGWHPTAITVFFNVMDVFADWTRFYFLFGSTLSHYDFMATGMAALIIAYISRRSFNQWWEICALTVLAQLTFEYFGMVFGIALAVSEYAKNVQLHWRRRLTTAIKPLLIVGVVTITIAGINATIFYVGLGNTVFYDFCGGLACTKYNFESLAHFKFIVAGGLSVILPAAGAGVAVGMLLSVIGWRDLDPVMVRQDFTAAAGVVIGLALAAAVGLFTVPYPAEMGRQFMPFAIAVMLASMRGTQLTILILYKRAY